MAEFEPVTENTAAATPKIDRVSWREKIGLGLGKAAVEGTHGTLSVLLSQVYTITMGLPTAWVSNIAFVQRIWDAMLDPFFGQYSDNLRSRWGRRIPMIFAGAIPLGFMFAALWWFPRYATTGYLGTYLLLGSLAFYTAHSLLAMPLSGLIIEATDDYHERTKIAGVTLAFGFAVQIGSQWIFPMTQMAIFKVPTQPQQISMVTTASAPATMPDTQPTSANAAASAATLAALTAHASAETSSATVSAPSTATASEPAATTSSTSASTTPATTPAGAGMDIDSTLNGLRWVTAGCAIVFILAGLAPVFLCRERMYKRVAVYQKRMGFLASLRAVRGNHAFTRLLWARLAFSFGFNVVQGLGLFMYYYRVWKGNIGGGAFYYGIMGSAYHVSALLTSLFVFPAIERVAGKRLTMQIAASVLLLGCLAKYLFYQPGWVWLPIFVTITSGVANAGVALMATSMLGDITDEDELNTGMRREGLFSSLLSWVDKAGNSVGTLLTGYILAWIGFIARPATVVKTVNFPQSEWTLSLMKAAYIAGPLVGAILTIWLIRDYALSQEKAHANKEELARRRSAANLAAPIP